MITALDHAVIVVNDLAAATRDYAALGFTVAPGGMHTDGQTHNALVAFADGTYLELLAFVRPEAPSTHYWWPRLAEGEGLEDLCLRSDDLAGDAARWQAAGLAVQGPNPGGRQRPDGQELRWRTVRFTQAPGDATLPFIIQDETPRDLRVPGGAASNHPRALTGLRGVRIVTGDLPAAMRAYIALLGSGPIGQTTHTAQFIVGGQWIELRTPTQPEDALAQHLRHHGAGPYALVLAGDTDPLSSLDTSLMHGARISVS
jgi:catechol 2,3-dioxygenase-like lactoylglutathione lyase family enzyme